MSPLGRRPRRRRQAPPIANRAWPTTSMPAPARIRRQCNSSTICLPPVAAAWFTWISPVPPCASYVEPSGQSAGSISVTVVPATDYFAPAALAQGTLVFHATTASHSGTATLNDGNFMIQNASGGGTSSGTYTYAQYSPTVGMLILTHTDPADAGDISYLQLTFNSAGGGSIVGDAYDTNSGGSTAVGTFTLAK